MIALLDVELISFLIGAMDKLLETQNLALAGRTRVDVLGVLVDDLTLTEAADRVVEWVVGRRSDPTRPSRRVVTANPEYVMAARRDRAFGEVVNGADLVTADGAGLIAAGRILGQPFPERVTGVALAEELFRRSAGQSLRLFLLGATPGVAQDAAERLRLQYPGIVIVGTWAGQAGPEGDAEAIRRIRHSGAEVVLVAYGMLKQDWWLVRNLSESGAAVGLGIGGVLDYKAGRVRLAPVWLRKLGLEWLYRLYREPWRWRRQLALPRFGVAVLGARLNRLFH